MTADGTQQMFVDRREAGRLLGQMLSAYSKIPDVLVLGLPRGGVVVAFEVAKALRAPLDIFMVRKLGVPWHEELAMGAIASGGVRVLNQDVIESLGIDAGQIESEASKESAVLARRQKLYRGTEEPPPMEDRIVILVDDGLATGATMRTAVTAVKKLGPKRVVVAVPVAPPQVCRVLEQEADEVHCRLTPPYMVAIGSWYEDFDQVTDEEVTELLLQARAWSAAGQESGRS